VNPTQIEAQTAIDLIGSTKTTTGLEVICVRDDNNYQLAQKVSDERFKEINIHKILPFDLWNYKILPPSNG